METLTGAEALVGSTAETWGVSEVPTVESAETLAYFVAVSPPAAARGEGAAVTLAFSIKELVGCNKDATAVLATLVGSTALSLTEAGSRAYL